MFVYRKFLKEEHRQGNQVWRYVDFTKFVDLLDSSCLFFSRLTVLQKADPYEGSFMPFVSPDNHDKGLHKALKEHGRSVARTTFVSSWYLSEVESAALWRLFPKSDEGIAIKSTVDKLMKSLAEGPDEYKVWITSVTYGHERTRERKANGAKSYSSDDVVFTKRACFEHEKELRLVIYGHDLAKPIPRSWRGVKVPVNINSLISEVVVGPEAPHWMRSLVERVSRKYGYSITVTQSTLNQLRF